MSKILQPFNPKALVTQGLHSFFFHGLVIHMKVVLSLADVNGLKMCPVCKAIYPRDYNFCPHEEDSAVELLEIEVIP